MALFFDGEWFDTRLKSAHLSRGDVARALGLDEPAVAEIWKDQRELSARDVSLLAALLAVPPQDIAHRAGISTPVPKTQITLSDLAERLARVESELARIKARLGESKTP